MGYTFAKSYIFGPGLTGLNISDAMTSYTPNELAWMLAAIKAYVNDIYPRLSEIRDQVDRLDGDEDADGDELDNLNDQQYRLDQKITAYNDLFHYLENAYDSQYRAEYNKEPPPKMTLYEQ